MAFTDDDKIVIKFLRQNEHYAAKQFISEFPEKRWSLTSLKRLIRKIDATEKTERTKDSGRPRTARKVHNIDSVDKLPLSQDDKPGTHSTQRVTCCIRLVVRTL